MGRRARGQATAEFVLVAPLIFAILFGVLGLSVAAWDGQVADHAARVGGEAANEAMRAVNARFSTDARLTTAWIQGSHGNTYTYKWGTVCRRVANRAFTASGALDGGLARRIGWDWGCLYDPVTGLDRSTGTAKPGDGDAAIAAPLLAAVAAARGALDSGQFIWGDGAPTVSACYGVWKGGDVVCALTATSTAGGATVVSGRPGTTCDGASCARVLRAPSFVVVTVSAPVLRVPLAPDLAPAATRTERAVLDRWLPPCPATVDACGDLF